MVLQLKALAFCDAERVNVLLDAVEDLLSRHRGASLRGRRIEGTSQLRETGCKMRRPIVSDDSAEAAGCPPGSSVVLFPALVAPDSAGVRSQLACVIGT